MTEKITLPDGRTMTQEEFDRRWALLSKPFPSDQVEKLPKQLKSGRDQPRWQCRQGTQASADGHYCGGYHGRAIHLDYIGHATITERLNEVDPFWTIKFHTVQPETNEPKVSADGTWFVMTVLGIQRVCVGDSGGKPLNGNGHKELIGDAIRNGAMRFNVATYLWSKSEKAERIKQGEVEEAQEQPTTDWVQLYNNAINSGYEQFQSFMSWASSQSEAPQEMLTQGKAWLQSNKPVEGEIVND